MFEISLLWVSYSNVQANDPSKSRLDESFAWRWHGVLETQTNEFSQHTCCLMCVRDPDSNSCQALYLSCFGRPHCYTICLLKIPPTIFSSSCFFHFGCKRIALDKMNVSLIVKVEAHSWSQTFTAARAPNQDILLVYNYLLIWAGHWLISAVV